jgi:hypothetical protein
VEDVENQEEQEDDSGGQGSDQTDHTEGFGTGHGLKGGRPPNSKAPDIPVHESRDDDEQSE